METTPFLEILNTATVSTGNSSDYGISQTPFQVFVITFATLAVVASFLLNPLMLLTLRRVASIQTTTKIFMASLTLSDFCNGIFWVFKLPELYAAEWLLGDFLCRVSGVMVNTFHALGIFSLLLLTLDRYIAILFPLRYPRMMTIFRAKLAVCVTWTTAFISCILLFGIYDHKIVLQDTPRFCVRRTYSDWRAYVAILVIAIPLVTIFVIYAHVLLIARRHSRQIAVEISSDQDGRRTLHRINLRSTTTIIIITSTLIITWVPSAILLPILASKNFLEYDNIFFAIILPNVLLMSNSWLNVIIYYLRNRDLRRTIHDVLSDMCHFRKTRDPCHSITL
ncbi:galanin receptor 2b-like [Patiria miniata]|uniref:G-protein coupled receptors family 1 profile domain-containing protein n=1 Tax=Patiria miniata TaxID=46514 RepID=A0A914A6T9_PATMI|nr:galanin receptor 2b-like [Patiria miniata]